MEARLTDQRDDERTGPTVTIAATPVQISASSARPTLGLRVGDIVRVRDNQFAHGTHVTGIAAGDGSQAGTKSGESCAGADNYIGVAPEAIRLSVGIEDIEDILEDLGLGGD